MFSGWINLVMNTALFICFVVIIISYYKPKKKAEAELAEQPKYKMLEDDDEDRC